MRPALRKTRSVIPGGSDEEGQQPNRSAVGVAFAAAFILVWLIPAVDVLGREGDPADLMYAGVLAVGIAGAIIARLQPHGMARAVCATALAQALLAVIALLAGEPHSPSSSVSEILRLNGLFVALFVGSPWLFRHAAQAQPPAPAPTRRT